MHLQIDARQPDRKHRNPQKNRPQRPSCGKHENERNGKSHRLHGVRARIRPIDGDRHQRRIEIGAWPRNQQLGQMPQDARAQKRKHEKNRLMPLPVTQLAGARQDHQRQQHYQ